MFRVGLYARVSTHDQQTLPLQMRAMREYAAKRGWTIAVQIKEVGSGAVERELREKLLAAARRREIDVVLVWRLDRWGRSLVDLVVTLKELAELGVGFVSLTEALDLTTPTGRAMAGLLSVFAEFEHEILRERIRAGIAEARLKGKHLGRPVTVGKKAARSGSFTVAGVSKAEIARRLEIGRTSVRRILADLFPGEIGSSSGQSPNVRQNGCRCCCSNLIRRLWTAIEQARLIRLIYHRKSRILEPHDYGILNGSVQLLGYQVGGSSSRPIPNWLLMKANEITDLELLDQTFPGGRPTVSGKHHQMGQAVHQSEAAAERRRSGSP